MLEVAEEWTTRLTGLSVERIRETRERLDALGIKHLSDELSLRVDIDAMAGSCMLVSAMEILVDRGVPESKLVSKLRGDRDVWPTIAEIIAGRLVLGFFDDELMIEMDRAVTPGGPNADFRISAPDGPSVRVEFKALGLSDIEVSFFRTVSRRLPDLVPQSGVATYHMGFDESPPLTELGPAERDSMEVENRERQRRLPAHIRDLRGAVAAGYLAEDAYVSRLCARVREALRQLRGDDDAWVAVWWSNGASLLDLRDAVSKVGLPGHVLGLMVLGAAVIVPDPRIHYFHALLPRADLDGSDVLPVRSLEDDPTAAPTLSAFQRSVGLRPTFLVSPDGAVPILKRNGSRRILPFNLLVGPDPTPG